MKVDRITHSRDMVIRNFPRWRPTAILDLDSPEVGPFDPPTPKTLSRTKHEVDRMTLCRDMAVRGFPKCEVGRSLVGRRSSIYTLFSCTTLRYVRNVAREEEKCIHCDQLILRKISKIGATRCQILRIKCTKFDFRWGSAPDPAGELTALPRPSSCI